MPRKKGAPALPRGHAGRQKGRRRRSLLTAIGPVALRRTYRRRGACEAGSFPVDEALDLDRSLTERARRLACLFGVEESFARAGRLLDESAGWSPAPETLCRICHAEAARLRRERPERLDTAGRFARVSGDWELQTEAGKVNTPDGGRVVKCAAFTRRDRAEPIWTLGGRRFPEAEPVLDVFHAVEHLAELARYRVELRQLLVRLCLRPVSIRTRVGYRVKPGCRYADRTPFEFQSAPGLVTG